MVDQPIVFVVDDDLVAAQSVAALMISIGLPSETYASAEEFLSMFVDRYSDGELPRSCLVLDVRLPGMSGPELYEQLVAQGIDLPTILVSGHIDVEETRLPKSLTCLAKPYPSDELAKRVKSALGMNV